MDMIFTGFKDMQSMIMNTDINLFDTTLKTRWNHIFYVLRGFIIYY